MKHDPSSQLRSNATTDSAVAPSPTRRLPIGADVWPEGVHFRVWAPQAKSVLVVSSAGQPAWSAELSREPGGYFSGWAPGVRPGISYQLKLAGVERLLPDPASRFQPAGPWGASQIVDPARYEWQDAGWQGVPLAGQVLYEMHIGTFTSSGTWTAAMAQLAELAALGITVLEIMPIAEFPGEFGWSYDGANLFAPTHLYGTPDELRAFVDEAHRLGLGVILDVVYNHLGSVGEQVLRPFSDDYFSRRHENEWGAAINFDDEQSRSVRDFFVANVQHWITEYHFDGLRIDATQAFSDDSNPHILLELSRAAHRAGGQRRVLVIGENEPQRAALLHPAEQGGQEIDALWNDDFHHAAMVRLTGHNEAYYTDYRGSAEEFVAAAKWGFLFQGQRYAWQNNPRGTMALDIAAPRFIHFIQNHDQLANSARGLRIHQLTSPGRYRAMTALLLLAPQTPLLFQGQEFAASTPFLYFNDCHIDEAHGVREGRAKFLKQFRSLATATMQARLPDPADPATFRRSCLDLSERERHAEAYALHRDLLRLRREDPAFSQQDASMVHGATLGSNAFLLRFFGPQGQTRLLLVNFDRDLWLPSVAQPLLAPPDGSTWEVLWSSEAPEYGGNGTPAVDTPQGWRIPGEAALLLHPVPGMNS